MLKFLNADDRTQAPTIRKIEQSKRDGKVAISPDLVGALALTAGFGGIMLFSTTIFVFLSTMTTDVLGNLSQVRLDGSTVYTLLFQVMEKSVVIIGPVLLFMLVVAVFATWVQGGFRLRWNELAPDPQRINPARNIGRILDQIGSGRLVFGFLKIAAVTAVLATGVKGLLTGPEEIVTSIFSQPGIFWESTGSHLVRITLNACFVLVLLSGADWIYQRWQYQKSMMMSVTERKDEDREVNGDPSVRHRRRGFHQQILGNLIPVKGTQELADASPAANSSDKHETRSDHKPQVADDEPLVSGREGQ